jgi:hypothetical protein
VTWVTFEPQVSEAIAVQLGDLPAELSAIPAASPEKPAAPPPTSKEPRRIASSIAGSSPSAGVSYTEIGRTELTEGNIKNNHFYLSSFIDKFPADAIGGSNTAESAPRKVIVDWGERRR